MSHSCHSAFFIFTVKHTQKIALEIYVQLTNTAFKKNKLTRDILAHSFILQTLSGVSTMFQALSLELELQTHMAKLQAFRSSWPEGCRRWASEIVVEIHHCKGIQQFQNGDVHKVLPPLVNPSQ